MDMIMARIGGGYMYDKTRPTIEERSDLAQLVSDLREAKEKRKLLYLDRSQVIGEIHQIIGDCEEVLDSF